MKSSVTVKEKKSDVKKRSSFAELASRREKLLAPVFAQDWPNLPVVRAEGIYLYGLDGKKYMDFMAGFGVVNVGRGERADGEDDPRPSGDRAS